MNDFKGRHFTGEVILWAVRWYCRYGISYRDLEEMLSERGIDVDHTTIYRWVQRYAPEMEKRLRWFWRRGFDPSWRLDETYVKVRGKWTYLAQSARSCDFGHLGEHVGNGLVVVDDRPCEERRSAPIRERRYEPWRFEWGSDRLLEPEFFGHRVRDRQSGDGTTGIGGSA